MIYDSSNKERYASAIESTIATSLTTDKPRNLRALNDRSTRLLTEKKDESKNSSSSRAARINQRRLLKDVASFAEAAAALQGNNGSTSSGGGLLGMVDTLASRESQLRFDRSSIHAWGVFADTDITAGEMIVEYRGELIGNAVAERREMEYEAAKIGSDYMFRIDAWQVCDATKQGNVARFINASCDPNCYTKIISLDNVKRIVIYAKRDMSAGEELCYDYKFPVEYDEAKRIPCHCGARECRGFMNWVRCSVSKRACMSESRFCGCGSNKHCRVLNRTSDT
jgi:[histone H3]-lysine4 N-trimethyltransferase SETD1